MIVFEALNGVLSVMADGRARGFMRYYICFGLLELSQSFLKMKVNQS
jgi:hypothetical protein